MKYNEISRLTKEEILKALGTSEQGLKKEQVERRHDEYGLNIATNDKQRGWLYFLVRSFKDKFIMILFVLAVIDYMTNDILGAGIIVCLGIASAMIRFAEDYSTYRFNEKLRSKIKPKVNVMRDGKVREIYQEDVTIGDIVPLNAGVVIPADMVLIDSKDLFLNQSAFTGESVPVEKKTIYKRKSYDDVFNIPNVCFMGSNVVTGSGVGVVILI